MKDLLSKIERCSKCKEDSRISTYMAFSKPRSYIGSEKPTIMLIGHSPSVRTKEPASVVLKMNKENRPLFEYINENILQPLGLNKTQIYATNIIKCQTTKLPEDIDKKVGFFEICFDHCKYLLEEEIETVKPHLIISLSERVLKILSKQYNGQELSMKESFGVLMNLNVNGFNFNYIPLVHIPKGKNSLVAKHYFPAQTERLKKIRYSQKSSDNNHASPVRPIL
jgi:uracil-DNA glycosylase